MRVIVVLSVNNDMPIVRGPFNSDSEIIDYLEKNNFIIDECESSEINQVWINDDSEEIAFPCMVETP